MKNRLTSSRIIGGQVAESPIPWHAGVYLNNAFYCGATIIDEKTVLTAQRCVIGFVGEIQEILDKTKFEIVAGVVGLRDGTAQKKTISEIIIHPCLR